MLIANGKIAAKLHCRDNTSARLITAAPTQVDDIRRDDYYTRDKALLLARQIVSCYIMQHGKHTFSTFFMYASMIARSMTTGKRDYQRLLDALVSIHNMLTAKDNVPLK